MRPASKYLLALALGASSVFTLSSLYSTDGGNGGLSQSEARAAEARHVVEHNSVIAELNNAFRSVAAAVQPSVVRIEVTQKPDTRAIEGFRPPRGFRLPPGMPESFRHFFEPNGQPGQSERQWRVPEPRMPRATGSGSGWVYDNQGHIVTNNHVVEGADEIVVKFVDGAQYDAEVIGTDPRTDTAVLKIDAKGLHPALLAEEEIEKGDIVFAFGSPLSFEFSVSQGVVSGKHREMGILGPAGFENFIQTDAAINPGNSGGPLVNIRGRVVGTNTAIASRSGLFSGLGFAVPVEMIRRVVDQLVETGEVQRGYLGVSIQDDPELLASFGFNGQGVLIGDVLPDLPAAAAGIERGDIVTAIDGQRVESANELRNTLAAKAPGEAIELAVVRDGKNRKITVKLARMPDEGSAGVESGKSRPSRPDHAPLEQLGLTRLRTLTEEAAARYGVEETEGVLVEEVRPYSVAHEKGLRPGVVIVAVMGKPIANASELAAAVSGAALEKGVRLTVSSQGRRQFVFLKPSK